MREIIEDYPTHSDSHYNVEYVVLFYLYGDYNQPEYRTTEMENYIHKSAEEFDYEDCFRYARHVWETEFHSDLGTEVDIEVIREVTPIDDDLHTKSVCVVSAGYDPTFPDYTND